MYKQFIKPILFLLSPERAHYFTANTFRFITSIPILKQFISLFFTVDVRNSRVTTMGIQFKHPVGLAAGFDKNGEWIHSLSKLGFSHIEIGTVTPKPQQGNPSPRLFRLPKDEALINRMGFNNLGVEQVVNNLKQIKNRQDIIIGGNIGKNKTTPNDKAIHDYEACFHALFPYVDYFTVNVSSPNTPNLRKLQAAKPLQTLLSHLQLLNQAKQRPKPILLKISPDLSTDQIIEVATIVKKTNIAGVIATNTSITRENLFTSNKQIQQFGGGGLSGKPIANSSTAAIKLLRKELGNTATIIGVGGVDSVKAAKEKLSAGANLVQVYTGLIYQGPGLVKRIVNGLSNN